MGNRSSFWDRLVRVEYWYYEYVEDGKYGPMHKLKEDIVRLRMIKPCVNNGNILDENKRKLSGINSVVVEIDRDEKNIIQISGYNGNIGMYCFLVDKDGTLIRSV